MGMFDLLKQPDINGGVEEFRKASDAILLDARTPEEYREGHIPGSKNIPLHQLDKIAVIAENKDTVLYVYCHSGARSRQAAALLQHMGYRPINNIGGIAAYRGKVER